MTEMKEIMENGLENDQRYYWMESQGCWFDEKMVKFGVQVEGFHKALVQNGLGLDGLGVM